MSGQASQGLVIRQLPKHFARQVGYHLFEQYFVILSCEPRGTI